jgi:hypothetical protein
MKVSAFTNGAPAQMSDVLGAVRGSGNVKLTLADVLSAGVKVTDLWQSWRIGNSGYREWAEPAGNAERRHRDHALFHSRIRYGLGNRIGA